jgi:hypothetical protein
MVVIVTVVCLAGAAGALSIQSAQMKTSTNAARGAPSLSSTEDARATQAVVGAANRLTISITRARDETATVLASSFEALARSKAAVVAERSQLMAEQRQITIEAQQLTARAAALSAEGVTLRQEAVSLKAAQARAVTNVASASAPGGESSRVGGGQYDN